MTLTELLQSLSEAERDFIAGLDNGQDLDRHRQALAQVIANQGVVDFTCQYWFPYEVIELGKNWLQFGHEREYAACLGVVLKNFIAGQDPAGDVELMVENQVDNIAKLTPELKEMLERMLSEAIERKNE